MEEFLIPGLGKGKKQVSQEKLDVPENKEMSIPLVMEPCQKDTQTILRFPTSQIWNNLSIKIRSTSNILESIE